MIENIYSVYSQSQFARIRYENKFVKNGFFLRYSIFRSVGFM